MIEDDYIIIEKDGSEKKKLDVKINKPIIPKEICNNAAIQIEKHKMKRNKKKERLKNIK